MFCLVSLFLVPSFVVDFKLRDAAVFVRSMSNRDCAYVAKFCWGCEGQGCSLLKYLWPIIEVEFANCA